MKLLFAIIISSLIFFASCSNETNPVLAKQIGTSLKSNNDFLEMSTSNDLHVLESNLSDPIKKERTERWQPVANQFHSKTLELIEQIKVELAISENARSVSNQPTLIQKVEEFTETLLKTNSEVALTFANEIGDFDSSKTILINESLNEKNKEAKKVALYTLQNKALLLENKIVTFCKLKTEGGCILRYDKFSALVGQNTNQLKRGDTLEISAGVGAYSMAAQAKISFNGVTIPTIDGVSKFRLKAIGSPGIHSVPVNIIFINENGETVSKKFDIDYTIY